jgi:hypothetical protein
MLKSMQYVDPGVRALRERFAIPGRTVSAAISGC